MSIPMSAMAALEIAGAGSLIRSVSSALSRPDVTCRMAETLEDFMQVQPLMRLLTRRSWAPIDPYQVGTTLARLNHGGSGPDSGGVILAWDGDVLCGFALLQVTPATGLERLCEHRTPGPAARDRPAAALGHESGRRAIAPRAHRARRAVPRARRLSAPYAPAQDRTASS